MLKTLTAFLFVIVAGSVTASAQTRLTDDQATQILDQINLSPSPHSTREIQDEGVYAYNLTAYFRSPNQTGRLFRVPKPRPGVSRVKIEIPGEPSFYAYMQCSYDICGWDGSNERNITAEGIQETLRAVPATLTELIPARIIQYIAKKMERRTPEIILESLRIARFPNTARGQIISALKPDAQWHIRELESFVESLKHLRNWQGGNFVSSQKLAELELDLAISKSLFLMFP